MAEERVTLVLLNAKLEAVSARLDAMDRAINLSRQDWAARLQYLENRLERIENWKSNIWLSMLSVVVSIATLIFVVGKTVL